MKLRLQGGPEDKDDENGNRSKGVDLIKEFIELPCRIEGCQEADGFVSLSFTRPAGALDAAVMNLIRITDTVTDKDANTILADVVTKHLWESCSKSIYSCSGDDMVTA